MNKRKANRIEGPSQKVASRTLVGKPHQSTKNIAAQLMDVADHLSRKGFATISQHIDVTKPVPVRLDIEFEAVSSYRVAAPPPTVPAPVPIPTPAPNTRGRRNRNVASMPIVV